MLADATSRKGLRDSRRPNELPGDSGLTGIIWRGTRKATALAAYLRGDAIAGAAQSLRTEVTGPVVAGWIGMHGLERPFADALFHADRDYQQHVQANAVLSV
ncbi:MAG TPA: hypothetical protein VGX76_06990 [Pirellulales bacterium]|nr:hypothetical protein [Pirellulales bacterium]